MGKFMRGFVWVSFILCVLLWVLVLVGCATLEPILSGVQDIAATGEANTRIEASLTIIEDIVEHPWDKALAIAIGYGAAMLRRWYKKKKGSKTI